MADGRYVYNLMAPRRTTKDLAYNISCDLLMTQIYWYGIFTALPAFLHGNGLLAFSTGPFKHFRYQAIYVRPCAHPNHPTLSTPTSVILAIPSSTLNIINLNPDAYLTSSLPYPCLHTLLSYYPQYILLPPPLSQLTQRQTSLLWSWRERER